MRKFLYVAAAACLFYGAASFQTAQADDCNTSAGATSMVTQNPQRFNGRWWYWSQNGWLVWTGSQWVDYRSDAGKSVPRYAARDGSTAAGRSFSYQPGYGDGNGYGSSGRMNISGDTIDGSYGVRAADSKVLGNYH